MKFDPIFGETALAELEKYNQGAAMAVRVVKDYNGHPLKERDLRTLGAIAHYYPQSWASCETLAALLGISIRATERRLSRLHKLGLLKTKHSLNGHRAERQILIPGLGKNENAVERRFCRREGCPHEITHLQSNARTCGKACKEALRRGRKLEHPSS